MQILFVLLKNSSFSVNMTNMFRKLLAGLFLLSVLPVSAGQLERAMQKKDNVFLYLYKENCGLCRIFNPVYDKLVKRHSDKFCFLKVNTDTQYGRQLVVVYNVQFVPFVALIRSKDKRTVAVNPRCVIEDKCAEKSIDLFLSQK